MLIKMYLALAGKLWGVLVRILSFTWEIDLIDD